MAALDGHLTDYPRAEEIGLTDAEIAERKAFLEFGPDDVARLTQLGEVAEDYADALIDSLYDHFLSFEESREFFGDPRILERVKTAQKAYFLGLTQGEYGAEYVEERLKIGAVHERIDLPTGLYLGAYSFYLRGVAAGLWREGEADGRVATMLSLLKLVFLDMGLAIDTYLFERERTIRRQQTVLEFSTPVLQVRDRLLVVPVIGVLDSSRARQLTEQLLHAISSERAKVVVVDITGVPDVDSQVANHLVQTVLAARLMGAATIVTGLSGDIAQTLVRIGVDLGELTTAGDLQGGLEMAEGMLGYRTVHVDRDAT